MLEIRDLHASVGGEDILKGLSLNVRAGEVHAIMGPNGAGKSTLTNVLAGRDNYEVTGGEKKRNEILQMLLLEPMEFLKASLEATREARGLEPWDSVTMLRQAREACKQVDLDPQFLKRGVNEGFSGGEKKRNEILQMLLLEPKLALLDETDSGLDIDALQVVARGVNSLRSPERAIVLVTHYQRLLDYIVPDHVHVLSAGKIIKSGDKELAKELEAKGYGWLNNGAA